MTIDELLMNIKACSFEDIVCLTDIQSEEDKQKYGEQGYQVSFTEGEFKKKFPKVPPKNIYYIRSISSPTLYFNKTTLAVAPFHAEFYAAGIMGEKDIEGFASVVAEREQKVAEGDFMGSILTLPDAMRIEYFDKLVEQYKEIPNLYKLFFDVYLISDYGFERVSKTMLEVVLKAKTGKDKARTKRVLKDKPDILTIYRGGSIDKSTPANKAYSWSLDMNVANFFACRHGVEGSYLAIGEVEKEKVIDAFLDGNEKEIVVDPKDVKIIDMLDIKGLAFCEEVIPQVTPLFMKYREAMSTLDFAQDSSVHGKEHEVRVLLLCLTLGHMLKLPMSDMKALATAAIYHDTQRVNDKEDLEHGLYSRKYYEEEAEKPDPVVSFLIEYHSQPDEVGFKAIKESRALSKNRSRVERLYKVFKDADALDRVRFGLRDLDMGFLRIPESKQLTLVAKIYYEQIKV